MSPRAWQRQQDLIAQANHARAKHAKIHARKAEIVKARQLIEQGLEPKPLRYAYQNTFAALCAEVNKILKSNRVLITEVPVDKTGQVIYYRWRRVP